MLTDDDLDRLRALVRAELAALLPLRRSTRAEPAEPSTAALEAWLVDRELVTTRYAAAELLDCRPEDATNGDLMRAARVLRALGWERCRVARKGEGRGWHYRRAKRRRA